MMQSDASTIVSDPALRAKWRIHTSASIVNEARFACLKHRSNLHVVGVAGFSRPWIQLGLHDAALAQTIADVRATLCHELAERQRRHGARLVVASGATKSGVARLAYEVCTFLNITAMGIAPEQALEHPLSQMHYMLPFGHAFGDESPVFVRTIDELVVVGGGAQSERELLAAAESDRPITIIQGFGGIADEFSPAALPKAHFVRRIATAPRLNRTTNDQR
jgi:TRPM family ion channel